MKTETAGEQLARMGTDADAWTREFVDIWDALRRTGKSEEELLSVAPGDWLHGWFCNALETGRSEGYGEGLRAAKLRERLRWRLLEWQHRFNVKVGSRLGFKLARLAPTWLRRYIVVQVATEAVEQDMPYRKDGYAGPDGLGYRELYHAADRSQVPGKCNGLTGMHYFGSGDACDCGRMPTVMEVAG